MAVFVEVDVLGTTNKGAIPVELATAEVTIDCKELDDPTDKRALANCLLKNIKDIEDSLDEEELESVHSMPYVKFKTKDANGNEYETKLLENPLYWKRMYQQTYEKLIACQAKCGESSVNGYHEKYLECVQEKMALETELKLCKEKRSDCEAEKTKLEDKLEKCLESKEELNREILQLYKDLMELKQSLESSGVSSNKLDKLLDKIADQSPDLIKNGMNILSMFLEKQAEVEKIKTAKEISVHLARAKEIEMKRKKTEKLLAGTLGIVGTLLSPALQEGLGIPLGPQTSRTLPQAPQIQQQMMPQNMVPAQTAVPSQTTASVQTQGVKVVKKKKSL